MPIYEYRCTGCHKNFEKFQKITDAPLETCADCGSKLTKLISHTSFTLKGGGWYKDGYSSAKETKKEEKKEEKKKEGKKKEGKD